MSHHIVKCNQLLTTFLFKMSVFYYSATNSQSPVIYQHRNHEYRRASFPTLKKFCTSILLSSRIPSNTVFISRAPITIHTNRSDPTPPTLTDVQPPAALSTTLTMKFVVPVMLTASLALLPHTMALPLSTELQLKREADHVASPTYPQDSKRGLPPFTTFTPDSD